MNPAIESLNVKLAEIENMVGVSEHDILSELTSIRNQEVDDKPCNEWKYEVVAFSCHEYHDHMSNWGTYFGPMATWEAEGGKIIENPSISEIDVLMIEYWKKRSKETNNPLLKARYSGLV